MGKRDRDRNRDLRRLRRADLLELLVEQARENESLKAEIEQLRSDLKQRPVTIDDTGSLAGVAEGAAAVIAEAQAEAVRIVSEAENSVANSQGEAARLEAEAQAFCDALRKETQETCISLLNQAEAVVEAMFAAASKQPIGAGLISPLSRFEQSEKLEKPKQPEKSGNSEQPEEMKQSEGSEQSEEPERPRSVNSVVAEAVASAAERLGSVQIQSERR